MHLSPYFTLREAERSATAARLGIDNSAPEEVIPHLRNVAYSILEPIRLEFGVPFSPNSWYRSLALNRALGSKDTSQHPLGQAVDIEVPTIPNLDLAHWIARHLTFDQLILEFHNPSKPTSGWVHVSYVEPRRVAGQPNRMEVLHYDSRRVWHQGLPS